MKATIMQPTYLPWLGYFDLMDQSDIFIFLDNVQFEKQSWQQRNRIKSPKGELLLTIPVIRKYPQEIREVQINNNLPWQSEHLKAIQYNYSKAKYFNEYLSFFEIFYSEKKEKLIDFTIPIILKIKDFLGINCKIIKSSELDVKGKRVELLIDICKKVGANEYLSPLGSKEYIDENNLFEKENIKLEYQQFEHPEYLQLWGKFVPYLSTIDLLFNCGADSIKYIRQGRKI
ncbi:MAG: WbqC family protein [Candidatus Pacebacteria bacterium]|nr:WbqC family protein [Candidatus Paceibacterota bacterium]